jgi:hypothetical protein
MEFRQQYPTDTHVVIYSDIRFTAEYLRLEMPSVELQLISIWIKE